MRTDPAALQIDGQPDGGKDDDGRPDTAHHQPLHMVRLGVVHEIAAGRNVEAAPQQAGLVRLAWTVGLSMAQVAALVATFFVPRFGAPPWSHLVSLAIVLALSGLAWRPLTHSRRILAIGALVTSILAVVSGFYLLYWKEGIRVDGYQDWGVWWHVAWSWAAAVFFFQHTWINRVQYAHFFRDSLRRWGPAAWHIGVYAVLVVGLALSWTVWKDGFDGGNYIALSYIGWLAVTLPAYAIWGWRTWRGARASWSWRSAVDMGLVPAAAVATLTGIPLAFFDPTFDAWGLKYASKTWHVWPSILFAVLVWVHSVQVWSTVRQHWKQLAR